MKKLTFLTLMTLCVSVFFVSCEKEQLNLEPSNELAPNEQLSHFIQEYNLEDFSQIISTGKTYSIERLKSSDLEELQALLSSDVYPNYLVNAKVLYISRKELSFEEMDALNVSLSPQHEQLALKSSDTKVLIGWGVKTYDKTNFKSHLQSWSGRNNFIIPEHFGDFKNLVSKNFSSGKRNKIGSLELSLRNFGDFTVGDPSITFYDQTNLRGYLGLWKLKSTGSNQLKGGDKLTRRVSNIGQRINNKADSWQIVLK